MVKKWKKDIVLGCRLQQHTHYDLQENTLLFGCVCVCVYMCLIFFFFYQCDCLFFLHYWQFSGMLHQADVPFSCKLRDLTSWAHLIAIILTYHSIISVKICFSLFLLTWSWKIQINFTLNSSQDCVRIAHFWFWVNENCTISDMFMGWNLQATAGFQDSDFCPKAIQMLLRCISKVIFHLSGFTL